MTNLINLYLQEVLDKDRIKILENLEKIKNLWFILWWWTWLALIFWHRESIDFDFFINNDIDTEKLFLDCLEIFSNFDVIKTYEEKNTLYILVNWVKISFFTYKYKNIWEIIETKYFNIFSVEDIACMKLWAIQNRATNKDYVDLYYLIQKLWVEKIIIYFFKKFGNITTKIYLQKSLIYFDDIIEEKLVLKDRTLNFDKIKSYLENEIKNLWKN